MRRSRTTTVGTVAVLSFLALAVAGCSDDRPPSPMPTQSSSTAPTTSPSPSASATTGTATPTGSATPSGTTPSGTASVPAGFSVDEVTLTRLPEPRWRPRRASAWCGSAGTPATTGWCGSSRAPGARRYQVHYVDQPLADGSGDVVDVRGDAYLEVMITLGRHPAGERAAARQRLRRLARRHGHRAGPAGLRRLRGRTARPSSGCATGSGRSRSPCSRTRPASSSTSTPAEPAARAAGGVSAGRAHGARTGCGSR